MSDNIDWTTITPEMYTDVSDIFESGGSGVDQICLFKIGPIVFLQRLITKTHNANGYNVGTLKKKFIPKQTSVSSLATPYGVNNTIMNAYVNVDGDLMEYGTGNIQTIWRFLVWIVEN